MISALTLIQGLLFIAVFFWLLQLTGGVLKNALINNIQLSAERQALLVEARMIKTAEATDVLAQTISLLKDSGRTDRDFIPSLFMHMLAEDPEIFALWAIFEPDAWDGEDARFAGSETYRASGRFYPWAYRDDEGKPTLDLAMAEDGEATGDYYSIPFETGSSLFLEPYAETVETKAVLMTTYAIPLALKDGSRYGVAGIDISLDFLSNILTEEALGAGIAVSIISPDGLILGLTGDQASLGKTLAETGNEKALGAIKTVSESGKASISESGYGPKNAPVVNVLVPIPLPGSSKSWVYSISIDKALVFREQTKAMTNLIIFFIASIILLLFGILLFSRQISSPIKSVSRAFLRMEDGDLTVRVPVTTRDEVGALAKAFNLFAIRISFLFKSVKKMTQGIGESSIELEESVTKSKNAVSEIRSCVEETDRNMGEQVGAIDSAQVQVSTITTKIGELLAMLERQGSAIADSSSGVEEMVGNIQSMAANTESVVREFENLTESSRKGKTNLNNVTAKIDEVALKSRGLTETNAEVARIADQTSLLAMNAAIEAAHAGKAGLGFAVVAKEIKKLAESSQALSKKVTEQLHGIEDVIAGVSLASSDTKASFERIMSGIERVNALEDEAYQAVTEQREGSTQVLAALTQMQDITEQVKSATARIQDSSGQVNDSMEKLNEVSSDLAESIRRISDKADEIDTASAVVYALAVANRRGVASLAEQVEKFQFDK